MPWWVTILIAFLFFAGGCIQWGFENIVEKRYEPETYYFYSDKDGKKVHGSFTDEFFKEYKIVKKTKKDKK